MDVPSPLTRQQLYDKVWAEPLRTIAREYGLSDVGLKKLCRRHDIPTPGLGYWAKVEFGKRVSKVTLPPVRSASKAPVLAFHSKPAAPPPGKAGRIEAWIAREQLSEHRISITPAGAWKHPLTAATEKVLKTTKPHEGGWLTAPVGSLALKVSAAQLPRALGIMDALLTACEQRGWSVTADFVMPSHRSSIGTFWYPGTGWTYHLPEKRGAVTGVCLLRQQVWFTIKELQKVAPPTEADIRAHRRKFPWGGDPPPRPRPTGELRLEIDQYPRVSLRHRYHDLQRCALEEQLNGVVVGIVRMAVATRADHARKLRETRRDLRAKKLRQEAERRREELRADIAHLRRGIRRWRWREQARAFLSVAKEDAAKQGLDSPEFQTWIAWAERYVEARGLDAFFAPWNRPSQEG